MSEAVPPPPMSPSDDAKTMAMLCHLLAFLGLIGIPFGNILGPLVVWLLKKDSDPFIDDQGKEALNFQITMTIAAIISAFLTLVLIGFLLLLVIGIAWVVLIIIAALKAKDGEAYRYPFTLRLL